MCTFCSQSFITSFFCLQTSKPNIIRNERVVKHIISYKLMRLAHEKCLVIRHMHGVSTPRNYNFSHKMDCQLPCRETCNSLNETVLHHFIWVHFFFWWDGVKIDKKITLSSQKKKEHVDVGERPHRICFLMIIIIQKPCWVFDPKVETLFFFFVKHLIGKIIAFFLEYLIGSDMDKWTS